ncbi:MAG: YdiU family protein [Planctomycetaceae bacterium]|jgi:serine/tyrosine/threonine adenylyltransferase|nr:YdiU family protein [Planctomycetaceae bacterium]MBT5885605.1 YdiU family protein [Planctomycetaceae bacterium]MBT7257259.1 YdiU family protein [Planctomycetaceae bacterium]MBT7917892.1 YdiU family protein [Planctomycetaceae bacterium]
MPFQFDNSYARLPGEFYSLVAPTPVAQPSMIRVNRGLAELLGADAEVLQSPAGLSVLAGNEICIGSVPLAMGYAGHQFGGFSPQLGDGRAVQLGEVIGTDGVRYDIQLKGSGPTRFSRRGDGRSALGPVLREYLVSEAMAVLDVPTTRALAAVSTGESVMRDGMIAGGILTRVAQSFVRVGTFQWLAARGDVENLKVLADYVIDRHYPEAKESETPYRALLDIVIERQAALVAQWMQLGFIHGVMNTDNTAVSGETIDYGPCAFMDTYESNKTFSSIDHQGRYGFGNQGPMAHWNLSRFAETLVPLLASDSDQGVAIAEEALDRFVEIYERELQQRFKAKIGLGVDADDLANADDVDWKLVRELLTLMEDGKADFTLVFRQLSLVLESNRDDKVLALFDCTKGIAAWLKVWRARVAEVDGGAAVALMHRSNPIFIPRNHRIEEVIEAGYSGDFELFHRLLDVLQHPFDEQPKNAVYEDAPTDDEIVPATFCGT